MEVKRKMFNDKVAAMMIAKGKNASGLISRQKYAQILNRLRQLEEVDARKSAKDYRLQKKYEITEFAVDDSAVSKLTKKGTGLRFICADELFNVIHSIHLAKGHGGARITHNGTCEKYANVTIEQIEVYRNMCETCQLKKSSIRKSPVVKPILSNGMNSRCQPKGADRKNKTDREKIDRFSIDEQARYQPVQEHTVLKNVTFCPDQFQLSQIQPLFTDHIVEAKTNECCRISESHPSSSSMLPTAHLNNSGSPEKNLARDVKPVLHRIKATVPIKIPSVLPMNCREQNLRKKSTKDSCEIAANKKLRTCNFTDGAQSDSSPNQQSVTDSPDPSEDLANVPLDSLTPNSQVKNWLLANRFANFIPVFRDFTADDLFKMSRQDLIEICGPADGIRLNNALTSKHIRPKLTIYVCEEEDKVYQAIFLNLLTVKELKFRLAEVLLCNEDDIWELFKQGPAGIIIRVTDAMIPNFYDESSYKLRKLSHNETLQTLSNSRRSSCTSNTSSTTGIKTENLISIVLIT